jgi:hypothetical protein
MWRIWWAPNNASKWQMGFNSAFKGLIIVKVSSASSIGQKSLFHHHLSTFLTTQFCIYIFRNRNCRTWWVQSFFIKVHHFRSLRNSLLQKVLWLDIDVNNTGCAYWYFD